MFQHFITNMLLEEFHYNYKFKIFKEYDIISLIILDIYYI